MAVKDPGFPIEGTTPEIGDANLLFRHNFCQNMHENAQNWTEMVGGGGSLDLILAVNEFIEFDEKKLQ